MGASNSRRDFLKKLTGSALVAGSSIISHTEANAMSTSVVSQIKPLGFQWETQDPFLFCVHHEDAFPEGNERMGPDAKWLQGRQLGQDFLIKDGFRMYHGRQVPGFPGHPHRGFETVTVVRKGLVDHSDSMGASGRYGHGDVQWMTAGKGLQHAEMFPLIHADQPNPMELFQIWLNLPAKHKMVDPYFKMLWSEEIPHQQHTDEAGNNTTVEVIAGQLNQDKAPTPPPHSWAAETANEVAIWNILMQPGAIWTLPPASKGISRAIYFYKGQQLTAANTNIPHYHSANLMPDHPIKLQAGSEACGILLLQGKPINEPVVQHGPFVMNSRAEIQQAFMDYQQTQFGGWPWPEMGPVHDRSRGRFAYHADGRKEVKS